MLTHRQAYEFPHFIIMTKLQLKEINLGKKKKIDISLFNKECFSPEQMRQIRLGLEERLDAFVYADPNYDEDKMFIYRMLLKYNKYFDHSFPVDVLLYDLSSEECKRLFCIIFSNNNLKNDFNDPEFIKKIKKYSTNNK